MCIYIYIYHGDAELLGAEEVVEAVVAALDLLADLWGPARGRQAGSSTDGWTGEPAQAAQPLTWISLKRVIKQTSRPSEGLESHGYPPSWGSPETH